jgi:hypothetical protein
MAAGAALAYPAPSSAAVTIGSDLSAAVTFGGVCTEPCTIVNHVIPGRPTTAPFDGVITSWRIKKTGDWGTVNLQVLRRVTGAPDTYIGVGTSANQATGAEPATLTFDTQLPILEGDYIGLNWTNQYQGVANQLGVTSRYIQPPPEDGGDASPVSFSGDEEVFFNADIEPDCDRDGLGDESQDSLVLPGCEIDLQLRGKKRQPLKRLNVKASCFDDPCDVEVNGKIVAGGERFRLKPRERAIEAGAIERIGLRVKGSGKGAILSALLALGDKAKGKLKATAIAPNGVEDTAKKRIRVTD